MARPLTFEEIGKELGLSRQRVERIYAAAIQKLQKRFGKCAELRDLLTPPPVEPPRVSPAIKHRVAGPPVVVSDMSITPVPKTTDALKRTLRSLEKYEG